QAHSHEVAQLDQAALTAINLSQRFKGTIQCHHFDPARFYFQQHFIEWDLQRFSATLGAPPPACMVHQNMADHLCAKREEMRSVLASDSPCARELKVDLISQRGGFQTLPEAPSQILPTDPPEFRIQERPQA